MTNKLKKTLIGAGISVALAAAVSYGLISQDTADTVQTRADQALSENPPADGNSAGGNPADSKPADPSLAPNAPAQPNGGQQTPQAPQNP